MWDKIKQMDRKTVKRILFGLSFFVLAFYVGGLLTQVFKDAGSMRFQPFICLYYGMFTVTGLKNTVLSLFLFLIIGGVVIYRGNAAEDQLDEERNFEYSRKGTYGTAGYMTKEERAKVLAVDKDLKNVDGILLGLDIDNEQVISLPKNSMLNRNFAVCGSQGSMKSRAVSRNMILQCVKRGESMFVTDPKSELYEDMVAYLKNHDYIVKQWNLISLENSDAWDCLAEIDDGGLIDIFVDVVIRNTTDKFDHFYDNTEMDLLKALCLYVYREYHDGDRTFPEAYKLLLNQSLEALDATFDGLPENHPAKGSYRLFSKAEKVKGNAILGLGTRLQIMQNKLVQEITSHKDIDLTLPGQKKCAYFCITSDQDSTFDVLATLFVSFLCIKLVRFADRQPDRKLPVPVFFILDEFPNIGVVPDFKKKLATARSRQIGMCILYQNIPQLQNRYPDGQWEEILGGCDTSLFLGCNDMTTATYFSGRSGEVTVGVSSIRKSFQTMRMTDYVPDYTESSSVGKRMLLLPDEVLRFPLDQALLIIRGQKVLRVKKLDYTRHPEAKFLEPEKTDVHTPEWRKEGKVAESEDKCVKDVGKEDSPPDGFEQKEETLTIHTRMGSGKQARSGAGRKAAEEEAPNQQEHGRIERVEDLFH
ncbi:type IV secretion system protein VirD4 [Hungatella effluvii]|uniref:Type IV secretion system protein VirD4 n=1 Tax=Hungatella effluvii TaxID=1096246 RepID=A0A2V3Y1R9_9FIRM|nr:type IV secretory system conjugative DNA transfer family protein [Hungatella effluvii]PXX52041.1 type IV secretion system protein VirD4 [Hungatella effluvii]